MKFMKIAFAAVFAFAFGNAYAFHSGGVAECEGCHTMHNSYESKEMGPGGGGQYAAGPYLLKGSDQSSTCLECHAETPAGQGYHVMDYHGKTYGTNDGSAPGNFTPGGDFAWVLKTFTWTPRAGAAVETSKAERHGHNTVAADFSIGVDAANKFSPGGTYPAASLACSSCHDPHGKYRRLDGGTISNGKATSAPIRASGSYYNGKAVSANEPNGWSAVGVYRILGGTGYAPKSVGTGAAFTNTANGGVPVAKVNSTYNNAAGEATTQMRVAYGAGMSEWCGNCHASMHRASYTSGTNALSHPAGNGAILDTIIAGNYNAYVKSGDLSGTSAKSGTTLVPFETGSTDYAALALLAVNSAEFAGPDASAQVSCMSCHRAHASGFDSILRYGLGNEFMTVADTASGAPLWPDPAANPGQAQGRTTVETAASYYLRPVTQFAPYQRVLCNKCHAKD